MYEIKLEKILADGADRGLRSIRSTKSCLRQTSQREKNAMKISKNRSSIIREVHEIIDLVLSKEQKFSSLISMTKKGYSKIKKAQQE